MKRNTTELDVTDDSGANAPVRCADDRRDAASLRARGPGAFVGAPGLIPGAVAAVAAFALAAGCGGSAGSDDTDAAESRPDAAEGMPDAPAPVIDAVPTPDAAPAWTCDPSFYDANDGCDCECGIWDPDCALPGPVYGCEDAVAPFCTAAATCGDYCSGYREVGSCADATTVAACWLGGDPPAVFTTECPAGFECIESQQIARCELSPTCTTGATYCADGSTLQTCVGGVWTATSCGAGLCSPNPGLGASCATGAPVATVTGRFRFQYRPRQGTSGFGAPVVGDAAGMLAVVFDGAAALASAYTAPDGTFSIPVYTTMSSSASVVLFPYILYADGRALSAIAYPDAACPPGTPACVSLSQSAGLWAWSIPTGGAADVGTWQANEEHGSGAIHIHQWQWYALSTLLDRYPTTLAPPSLLTMWQPGVAFGCGACFVSTPAAMGDAPDVTHFSSSVVLTSTTQQPTEWSASVITHEVGHYSMWAFGRSPREGGPHGFVEVSSPGLAWSEGWASYHGQALMQDPTYFDVQNGGAIWVDLEQVGSSEGTIPLPSTSGGIDQPINEFVVASMLWDLADATPAEDPVALGELTAFAGLSSPRLLDPTLERGHPRSDVVDYLDGLRCDGRATAPELTAGIVTEHGFPYDNQPLCPAATSPLRVSVAPVATGARKLRVVVEVDAALPPVTLSVSAPAGATLTRGRRVEVLTVTGPARIVREVELDQPALATATAPVVVRASAQDAAFGVSASAQYPAPLPPAPPVTRRLPAPLHVGGVTVHEVVPLTR